jgi:hypothetical protein
VLLWKKDLTILPDEHNVSMTIDERKAQVRKDINESSKELQKNIGDAGSANKHSKVDRRKARKLAQKDKQTADSISGSLVHSAQEKSRLSSLVRDSAVKCDCSWS